jgi:DNA adenine methylase
LRNRYIEPFAGSAAIFFRLSPNAAILGDLNPHLMRLFSAIKSDPEGVSQALDRIRQRASGLNGKAFAAFYYSLRDDFPKKKRSENAALLLFLNQHCWNGLYRVNQTGEFNTPIGSYQSLRTMPSLQSLSAASEALQRASLQLADFEVVASMAKPGDFVYFDPPYAPTSQTARFTSYSATQFTWLDQVRLKRVLYDLTDRKISFLLSNSATQTMINLYKDFVQTTVSAARSINSVGSKRRGFVELLVSNFEIDSAEHSLFQFKEVP